MNKVTNNPFRYQSVFVFAVFLFLLNACGDDNPPFEVTAVPEWKVVTEFDSLIPFSVCFMSTEKGFVAGSEINAENILYKGKILKTVDGGKTWTDLNINAPSVLSYISISATGTGFAAGDGTILKTSDGGTTWKTVFNGTDWSIQSMSNISDAKIMAVDLSGRILLSTDNGENWTPQNSGTHCQLHSAVFNKNGTAVAAGYDNTTNHSYGLILRSVNNGVNWDSIPFTGGLMPVSTATTSRGDFIAGGNFIFESKDDGKSWSQVYYSPYVMLNELSFFDASNGLAVGQDGCILKTADGGIKWNEESKITDYLLLSVQFSSLKTAFVTGFDGLSGKGVLLSWQ